MPTVTANGKEFNFPDGTSDEDMGSAIDEFFNPPAKDGGVVESTLEVARAGVQNFGAEVAGGLAGVATLPLGIDSSVENIDDVTNALSFFPETRQAQEFLQGAAELLNPVIEGVQGAGKFFQERGAEFGAPFGEQGSAIGSAAGALVLPIAGLVGPLKFTKPSPLKQKVKDLLESDVANSVDGAVSQSNLTAKYMIDGMGKVRLDPIATEVIRQGFDEGVVAAVKGATATDRGKMVEMLDLLEKGRANARFAITNRPSDIVGNSIRDRILTIKGANMAAGKALDIEAKKLQGQPLDYEPSVGAFIDELDNMGITLGGDGKLNFSGSRIEGIDGAERVLNNLFKRMRSIKKPDAMAAHNLKRFIDEHVTFGKNNDGLSGKTETVLKNFRRNLDGALDQEFPGYNAVNTQYSETIEALNNFQGVAGTKMNLLGPNADKAVGTLSRRLMSNAQSRVNLLDSITELDVVASKYGAHFDFDDDIITQAMVIDELEAVFGPQAKTSLQGDFQKVANSTLKGEDGITSLATDKLVSSLEKARGINEEAALKAFRALLSD